MRVTRMIAALALVAAFALPMAGNPADRPLPEPKDTPEYKLSALVVDGQITKVTSIDKDNKEDSKGSRYRLVLKVSLIRKVEEASAEVGGEVRVIGSHKDDKGMPYPVPEEKDAVVAFLQKVKGSKDFEPVSPKTGWRITSSKVTGAPARK